MAQLNRIAARRLDVDVEPGMRIATASMLGLIALLRAAPDLDADTVADDYATRILCALGLSYAGARELVARPLPDITVALK